MPEQTTARIDGVNLKTTSKGDLFVVSAGGTEYSTFQPTLGNQARQLIGQTVALRFTAKQVYKDGREYTNRYYEGAEPTQAPLPSFGNGTAGTWGGPSDIQQLPIPMTSGEPERQTRIMRQTATKVAAHMLVHLPEPERTPDSLIAISEYLVHYYEDGPAKAPSFHDTPPAGDGDDIPF